MNKKNEPIKLLIIGAGNRGQSHASYAEKFPERAIVVGVAEPREFQRNLIRDKYNIPEEHVFNDWRDAAKVARFADAIILATQDQDHRDPAVAFADLGYHILLEKPMAITEKDCIDICDAIERNKVIVGVCHVVRFSPYARKMKELVASGVLGQIITMQHIEPVSVWHMAHSYVRGNWRNEKEACFMLMAKSCHDIDWIYWIMDEPCKSVFSYGSRMHFREENHPEGASDRCIDCAVEAGCPYSAKRIYMGFVESGNTGYPLDILTNDTTADGVRRALAEGPYGRCVYKCDNDVVDHQVVNMEFASGALASFIMTGFSDKRSGGRASQLHGTHGEIHGDGRFIKHYDFVSGDINEYDTKLGGNTIFSGHGGGDVGVMNSFTEAVIKNDQTLVDTSAKNALESHRIVFAAEQARLERRVVEL
jgi:predicted dehydrogenase